MMRSPLRPGGTGRKFMRIIKIFFQLIAIVFILMILAGGGLAWLAYWHFSRDLPDYQQLADYQPPVISRVYAGDGRLLAEYASERRVFVPIAAIPPLVVHAFLAAEDKNFYSHPGIDPLSMLRAAATDLVNLRSGRRPLGASTITQQVAKNFLLSNEVSLPRKIKEALLALRIERTLSKDRILELYLNEIYLGGGSYGVAAAALNYFNKSLDALTVPEAAFLGALPKAPNNYNPQRFPDAAKARRDWVIGRMAEDGYIAPAEESSALAAPLETRPAQDTEALEAPYFAEEVRRELLARYGERMLYQGGLAVRTSLDPKLQVLARRALRDGLVDYDRKHGWRGALAHVDLAAADLAAADFARPDPRRPAASAARWRAKLAAIPRPPGAGTWRRAAILGADAAGVTIGLADGSRGRIPFAELRWARPELPDQRVGPPPRQPEDVVRPGDVVLVERLADAGSAGALYGLRQIPEVSGGLVVIDPNTGRVLAMAGGYDWTMSQFDRVTQAKRQPGSAIKPFVYMAALDNGFTPSTLILDAPIVIDQGPGLPKWKPTNYNTTKFSGPTPLRVGIEDSKNLMTARLGQVVGLDKVAAYVEKFGVMDKMPLQYAQLLGAGETTPLRLATAYAMTTRPPETSGICRRP